MLETLAFPSKAPDLFSKPAPAVLSKPAPDQEPQKKPSAFAEVMERALNEQKALEKELEQGKDIRKKLTKAKETLQKIAQDPDADSKAVETLEEVIKYIESLLGEEIEPSPLLADLAAQLTAFTEKTSAELENTKSLSDGARYVGEKIAFVMEGLIEDIKNNTLSLAQKNSIKELIFQAKAVSADSAVLLAKEPQEMPVLFSQNPKEELDRSAESLFKASEALPKEKVQEPSVTVRDLRTTVQSSMKTQAVEAALPQGEEASKKEFTLFSSLPKFEQAAQILQRGETPVPVARAQFEALVSQMSARAVYTLKDGGTEFRMKMTPPELGQMKVSFRLDDGIMQGKVVVSTPEAKAIFEENLSMLRESLRQAGVNIARLDVSLGGDEFNQAQDPVERDTQYKAVRSPLIASPIELMSRGLSMSEIDYMA